MSMTIKNPAQLLDQATRKALIKEFRSGKNMRRKTEAFRAYECLKDKTVYYVLDLLLKQFDLQTVLEMQYAMSNVSVLRKVIDKLAKVYTNGVKRTVPESPDDTNAVECLAQELDFNAAMHKCNRYLRTFKNTLVYVKPVKEDYTDKYRVQVEVVPPFHYDVIASPNDPTRMLGVVLSDYHPMRQDLYTLGDPALANRGAGNVRQATQYIGESRSIEQMDEANLRYVWWIKEYHFTTNGHGEIIAPEGNAPILSIVNPILELPFINFAGEQDGEFFADGGHDLVDAGIKINTMITNLQHVAISQGYGQLYMTGKDLPKSVKVGPNHCIQLEHEADDPTPTVGFLNSGAPIGDLRTLVEMQVALMLTTNNLSTTGFSTTLSGGKSFASGIALMIDSSESVEDVNAQAKIFVEREPEVWEVVCKWLEVYASAGLLCDDLAEIQIPKCPESIQLKINPPQPIASESEQLDVYQKRMDLGISSRLDIIMRDDPSLTEQEAIEKLARIEAEKQARMVSVASSAVVSAPVDPENESVDSPMGEDPVNPEGLDQNEAGKPPEMLGAD